MTDPQSTIPASQSIVSDQLWFESSGVWSVEQAILYTVAYADIFDYPLTLPELYRYLVEFAAPLDAIVDALRHDPTLTSALSQRDGYVMLAGRESIIETRRRRAVTAARLWPPAMRYGRMIAELPFVRMVAVTGALAVDNVERNADIDYLIVTEPGRLWLCRALVIGLVRLAALRGDIVCPNYFLSDRTLTLSERNLYTAHELAQMAPIAGFDTYHQLRVSNSWTTGFLPNAAGPPRGAVAGGTRRFAARRMAETALRTDLGARLESWEMERKIRKFSRQRGAPSETAFCPDWCKGHFDSHGRKTLDAFTERLQSISFADRRLEIGD
jgi:hypothetical protein